MPDVIQCPTCSKKFKLPEKPPAIFTCTGCGTAMDLSAFRSAAAAAAPAAPEAEASAGPRRERAGKSARASSARSSSRGASRAAAGSKARRGRGDEEEGDGDGRRAAPKKGNPAVVMSIVPQDVNIVLQRLEPLSVHERFDLIIATDVLIYYDVFEQSLALANVAKMLRPGGLFLSNNAVFELQAIPIGLVGYTDVIYMTLPGVGEIRDRLVWYQRQ